MFRAKPNTPKVKIRKIRFWQRQRLHLPSLKGMKRVTFSGMLTSDCPRPLPAPAGSISTVKHNTSGLLQLETDMTRM